ncbi:DUF6207 family protein [Streptomyces sp. NPDC052682]|uniref:DUF6207 family protein n=1 Tax=Streptomyces sp. NPDC052682 TaxID=3154954 RepID=UPI003427678B
MPVVHGPGDGAVGPGRSLRQHARLAAPRRRIRSGENVAAGKPRRTSARGARHDNEAHVVAPGLAVVEVAAADDETAFAIPELLATRCALRFVDRTTREPDEPGVRLRCFLDSALRANTSTSSARWTPSIRPGECEQPRNVLVASRTGIARTTIGRVLQEEE